MVDVTEIVLYLLVTTSILVACTGFPLILFGGSSGGYIDRHHLGGLTGYGNQSLAPDGYPAAIGAGHPPALVSKLA